MRKIRKYGSTTMDGVLVDTLVLEYDNNDVTAILKDFNGNILLESLLPYSADEAMGYSADYILCDLQNINGLELAK